MLQSIFYFCFSNKHHLESIHSKDYSWQEKLDLADMLEKNCVTLWLRVAPDRSDLSYYKFCNIIVDTMLLLGGGSKTPVTFKRESFIEIAIYLKPLTIAANIPMSRCYKSPRSASNNSILFYYTKAILVLFLAVRH